MCPPVSTIHLMFFSLLLIYFSSIVDARKVFRRNSRHLRRLSRHYDWEVDDHGGLRPVINPAKVERSTRECTNDSYILEKILHGYNRHKIPGGQVQVQVEVWVQEITTISDITSDFQLDIYISEMWTDPALVYSYLNPCKYNLSLNSILLERLWTPNSCFINSKTADIHKSPFPNIFLLIYANGSGPCIMDLTRFPFDNVTCSLTFESFNYNTDEVEMDWSPLGVSKMREKMELADYELINIENVRKKEPYPAGYWHELTMMFHFKRRAGWYILQAYLPTYLTITISWISFALGSKAIPARTMLGVNSLLAMTFQFGNIIRNLPRVSYVKAIDVWMLSCMTFVFCSLLELATVGYLSRDDENGCPSEVTHAPAKPSSSPPQNSVIHNSDSVAFHRSTKRIPKSEEESALLNLKDNDYGYIPPGFGLNGNLAAATMRALGGHCSCEATRYSYEAEYTEENLKDFPNGATSQENNLSPHMDAETSAKLTSRQRRDKLAIVIDFWSVILFPALFSLFNVAYWYHYLSE